MKTQITKIASINRLSQIASLAALALLLCFANGAWAQPTQVLVENGTAMPIFNQGLHVPVEFHFGGGQTASLGKVAASRRFVIEHINIQNFDSTQWFVELVGNGPFNAYTNTAYLLNPVTLVGGRSFGVVTSTGKMYAEAGTTLQFNFSNSSTNNQLTVPPNVWVEVWGYYESLLTGISDDF